MNKPKQSHFVYQELSQIESDYEIIHIINLSIKKYCEEHNKLKEHIKNLEKEIQQN